jgi:hypothetical protein
MKELFNDFDFEKSGFIYYEEFLIKLRVCYTLFLVCFIKKFEFKPRMPKRRIDLVNKVFDRMDQNQTGKKYIFILYFCSEMHHSINRLNMKISN